jgi:cytochrome P450
MSGTLDAGYTIPAGWGVMVCPPAVHLNPEIYEDPLAFNPWRWQVCAFFFPIRAYSVIFNSYGSEGIDMDCEKF